MRSTRIETLLAAATQHGEDSEPDHEVGDLQDCLRVALALMTPEMFEKFYASDAVVATLEAGGVG